MAALAGAVAAVVYFVAVAVLVREPAVSRPDERESIGRQTREVVATARAEAAASVTVRVVFATAIALGVTLTAVELLWQPRLADLLGLPEPTASYSARWRPPRCSPSRWARVGRSSPVGLGSGPRT